MGRRQRRKRSDSDEDDTLEQQYAEKRQKVTGKSEEGSIVEKSDKDTIKIDEKGAVENDGSSTTHTQIEKQRLKKQRRKELKQAKKERKKREEQELEEQKKSAEAVIGQERQKQKEEKEKIEEASSSQAFRTLRKGVQCKDIIIGNGSEVQIRKKVRVSYTLRAKNRYGKVIDSSKSFAFRLGRGEVIEGWDIGVQGMKVGGRRHLIVPPGAGYGRQNIGAGVGGILFFDVTILGS